MSVTYGGVTAFTLQRSEPREAAGDLPVVIETWRGASHLTDGFLSSNTVGSSASGGYIIDRSVREQGPYTEVDLIIALQPSTSDYVVSNGVGLKTVSMSATVTASNIIDNASSVNAERQITFYAPETRYTYFRLTEPIGPAFGSVSNGREPIILRSVITASGNEKEDDEEDLGPDRTFAGGTAPPALVSALAAIAANTLVSHESENIPGTPWYRCVDVISREFAGG